MQRFVFSGVVHPERAAINLPTMQGSVSLPDEGIEGMLKISIANSKFTAIFETELPVEGLATLKNYIADGARQLVDAYGYVSGCGYDVEVMDLIPPDGSPTLFFGVDIPVLRPAGQDVTIAFNSIMYVFADRRGLYLQRSLADFREAIRSPKDTAFFCYRAIESLRQYFVVEEVMTNEKASWERFRAALSIERDDINFVKDYADPLRHGSGKSISDSIRADLFKKTKIVIDRFVGFASKGYPKNN